MLPLMTLPLSVEVEISSCEALNWLGTVVSCVVVPSSTKGCPLPTNTFMAPFVSVVVDTPISCDKVETSCPR